jgi:hypothetical protein
MVVIQSGGRGESKSLRDAGKGVSSGSCTIETPLESIAVKLRTQHKKYLGERGRRDMASLMCRMGSGQVCFLERILLSNPAVMASAGRVA